MRSSKRRIIGLAGAAIWLVSMSAAFTIISIVMIGASVPRWVLPGVVIAAAVYIAIGVRVIRGALRLPGAVPPRSAEERVMMRRFIRVVIVEVIAIMAGNTVFAVMQRLEFIVPLDLLIVGVHFLPLAAIFQAPRYYALGGLFCVVSVLTPLLIPAGTHVGDTGAWYVVPSFGCAVVASVTAAFNLREAWWSARSASGDRP